MLPPNLLPKIPKIYFYDKLFNNAQCVISGFRRDADDI
jgi:hypothetical protein